MKVSELADELEVPASAVLAQCQRFGIDASWAGAELNKADVVVLRAEMASLEDDEVDEGAAAAVPAALPPTAVGSMPDLIDEVTPELAPETAAPGFRMAGAAGPDGVGADAPRRVPPRDAPVTRRLDRAARNSVFFLAVAILTFVVSNLVTNQWVVLALWVLTLFTLLAALYDANRGRRHTSTHPERLKGLALSIGMLVVAGIGLGGLLFATFTAVSDDPTADAAMGVGDLSSVQNMHWGYHRLTSVADNGWKPFAKDPGTCWRVGDEGKTRVKTRIEESISRVRCSDLHTHEVFQVFAMNRDADAPYPGKQDLFAEALRRCGSVAQGVTGSAKGQDPSATMGVEIPTEVGWANADHDVACVIVTNARSGALVD